MIVKQILHIYNNNNDVTTEFNNTNMFNTCYRPCVCWFNKQNKQIETTKLNNHKHSFKHKNTYETNVKTRLTHIKHLSIILTTTYIYIYIYIYIYTDINKLNDLLNTEQPPIQHMVYM